MCIRDRCGVYAYDLAETKAMQVMNYARKYEHPLQVQLEKELQCYLNL